MKGEIIKFLRQEKCLTQQELAKELQISRSAIALYETNKRQAPNDLIVRIAKFFDVSIDFLFGLEDL